MANADQEHIFVARIQKIWIMRCVDVPVDVSAIVREAAGENAKHPPVHGFIEGRSFRSTLSSAGAGCYRLHVHSRIWRELKIDAGAEVEITLMLDQAPRPAPVPADLATALAAKPRALVIFNALTLPLRRQVLWYLDNAKHASTREKRVKLIVQRMLERDIKHTKMRRKNKGKTQAQKKLARQRPSKKAKSR
jgi:hypothetical protein